MNTDQLYQLYQSGVINDIDRAFTQMIDRRLGGIDPWVALAAALVSRAAASGDVCLDLAVLTRDGFQATDSATVLPIEIPLEQWIEKLTASPAVGTLHEERPIVLDGSRLYLQRYWKYECLVARGVLDRCNRARELSGQVPPFDPRSISRIYEVDEDQHQAIYTALTKRLAVISGGPGTGKTFTIAQIILAMLRLGNNGGMRIRLAAPTGKAAARLQEALEHAFEILRKDGQAIPTGIMQAETIHRLLGAVPGKSRFLFNADNQLPAEAVIIDEASMIDLALMAKLIQAVPDTSRLILVGDKDQLASVEAGAVLGDICWGRQTDDPSQERPHHGLDKHIVVLKKNYRFDPESGIDALGAAVKAGDEDRSLALLKSSAKQDIEHKPFGIPKEMEAALERLVAETIAPAFQARDARKALLQLNTLKILSPLRKGPLGVEALNKRVEQILLRNDVIRPFEGALPTWYPGRPVMITCNDYFRNLFNGDVGIALDAGTADTPGLQVFFPDPEQRVRHLSPEQLPAHETVYAMTVHKSQGSEFDRVVLILPDSDVPLVTRELLYTAITRARRRVEIWGHADILKKAIARRMRRASGLRHALWERRDD